MTRLQFFTLIILFVIFSCTERQDKKSFSVEKIEVESSGIPVDSNQLYFPLVLFPEITYDTGEFQLIDNSLDTLRVKAHSDFLRKTQEPIIINELFEGNAFRLIWYRTFENPIIVRIENNQNQYYLSWKLTDGAGGYDLGELYISGTKNINEETWKKFKRLINKSGFWNDETLISELIAEDAEQWILEGKYNDNYHLILRNSFLNSPGKFLIDQISIDSTQLKPVVFSKTDKIETKEHGTVYIWLDNFPEFSDNELNLQEYLSKEIAKHLTPNDYSEGTAYIRFIVYEDGTLKDVEVIRGINSKLDEIFTNILTHMPKWKPGSVDGEYVRVQMSIPIRMSN
ncbi:MAG: energy transducer TonB [Ignavibacteria bacterium]|nr:energy transducer TonB [Ignavibacteria bacterium]